MTSRLVPVLAAVALLAAAACGGSSNGVSGPFAASGGIEGGLGSGLWGDTSSGPDGQYLGCLSTRHYAQVVTMRNRTNGVVTVTDVQVPDPDPRVIQRAGVQFRVARPSGGRMVVTNMSGWSTAHSTPVVVQPGQSLAVQSNFLMGHCAEIGSRPVVVDGRFTVWYLASGHGGRQDIAQRSARIVLSRGPILRHCSDDLLASNIDCATARVAAPACRKLDHPNWGECSAAGHTWNCTYLGGPSERCWLAAKAQWFKVRWPA